MAEMDFASIKKAYGEWLVNDYDGALTKNAAASYRTYLNALRKACCSHFGDDFFDSLSQSAGTDAWTSLRVRCAQYIQESKAHATTDRERKDWNNRLSAFHRYEEFLAYAVDEPIENEIVERTAERPARVRVERVMETPNLQYAESFTQKELTNKFLLRLKTQSRWYPDFDMLFPARLITAIFSGTRNNTWKNWMLSDLNDMHILKEDGTFALFKDVKSMTIEVDGSVSVKLNGNAGSFKMYTHTADNRLIPFVVSDPRYISIDHMVSMRTIMEQRQRNLPAFKEMTKCFNTLNQERTGALDPRTERDWVKNLLLRFPELKSDTMRTKIAHDLEQLDLKYELMEGHENSRKSATV